VPSSPISEIPSFQQLRSDIQNAKRLRRIFRVIRPLLRLLRVDVEIMKSAFAKIEDLERQATELTHLPDRFNALFAERGWVMYELMNHDLAKQIVERGESGDVDGAELELINYYTPDTIRWKLQMMKGILAFRSRIPLALKALTDYEEARYHACIPVILALMDGMVNELHQQRRGFFAEGVSLEAWDSVAAHSLGLGQLVRVMTRTRQTTVVDQITIPYRNGIMHGMDLGYDNKKVAAKCWAALFAARDWAVRAEQKRLDAPPDTPPPSWKGIFRQLSKQADFKKRLGEWRPRTLYIGIGVPPTGDPEEFQEGTPERKLAEYLIYWRTRNYGHMAKCLSIKSGYSANKLPKAIREIYESNKLSSFAFLSINDQAAALTKIETQIVYLQGGIPVERTVQFILKCEDLEGHGAVRGFPDSVWVVQNWRIF
jgi:hypothetical protein